MRATIPRSSGECRRFTAMGQTYSRRARQSWKAGGNSGRPRMPRSKASGAAPAIRIEPENEWAWCGERRLALTPKAFAVLRHLVEHAGRLITKDELMTTVWRDAIVSDSALISCIRDLRRALSDSPAVPRY